MTMTEHAHGQLDELRDAEAPLSRNRLAIDDLIGGARRYWIWTRLAVHDIKLRYRGSMLGPFWLTLTTALMIIGMGFVYGRLFNTPLGTFFPYLMLGLIIWQTIATMLSEACQTFMQASSVIQQVRMPLSVHAYRVVFRNIIIFAHNAVLIPIGLAIFQTQLNWDVLMIIPAFLALTINGLFVSIWLGVLSARFRDIPPIIASILQVALMVTPIFWMPEMLKEYALAASLNPFFALVDIMRAPLLGLPTATYSWTIVFGLSVLNIAGTFWLFSRFRARVPFWVG